MELKFYPIKGDMVLGVVVKDSNPDKWGNKVSIVELYAGGVPYTYRLVNFSKPHHYRQFLKAFCKEIPYGFHVKVEYNHIRNDCQMEYAKVGNYLMEWGDGEVLDMDPKFKELGFSSRDFTSGGTELFIAVALYLCLHDKTQWTEKAKKGQR